MRAERENRMKVKHKTSAECLDEAGRIADEGVGAANIDKALETYFRLTDAIRSTRNWLAALSAAADRLSEKAAAYARRAPVSTFTLEAWHEKAGATKSGVRKLEGCAFDARLTESCNTFARLGNGDQLTQDFLEGLPENWTRETLKLDNAALRGVPDTTLAANGLMRQAKFTWTKQEKGGEEA